MLSNHQVSSAKNFRPRGKHQLLTKADNSVGKLMSLKSSVLNAAEAALLKKPPDQALITFLPHKAPGPVSGDDC